MSIRIYSVRITGTTPLLLHADNIEWADRMDAWKNDPANRKNSKAGDDRTPPFRWIGNLYHDGNVIAMPSDNLMRCIMEGGAMVLVPGGRSGKSFKSQTQSGCLTGEAYWPLLIDGHTVPWAELALLEKEADFSAHQAKASALGFQLFIKRAKVGTSKHIRVRPRFDRWALDGTINVTDDQLTLGVMRDILQYAGQYKGLGDGRPGGKTPGPHGMFTAEIRERK